MAPRYGKFKRMEPSESGMTKLRKLLFDFPCDGVFVPISGVSIMRPELVREFIENYGTEQLIEDFIIEIAEWSQEHVSLIVTALTDLCQRSEPFLNAVLKSNLLKSFLAIALDRNLPNAKRSLAIRTLIRVGKREQLEQLSREQSRLECDSPLILGELIVEAKLSQKLKYFDVNQLRKSSSQILVQFFREFDQATSVSVSDYPKFNFYTLSIHLLEPDLSGGVLQPSHIERLCPFIERGYASQRSQRPSTVCPACGFLSLHREVGCFQYCHICGWLDDLPRRAFPTFKYSSDGSSLESKIVKILSSPASLLEESAKKLGIRSKPERSAAKALAKLKMTPKVLNSDFPTIDECLARLKI